MGEMMSARESTPRAPHTRTTFVAGGLAFAWSSILVVIGLLLLLGLPIAIKASENGGYCESIDHPSPCADALELFGPGLVVLPIGIWCLVASVGYQRRRHWATPAVVVTFALLAVGALVALILEAAKTDPSQPNAVVTCLALMSYFVTTAVLAAKDRPPGAAPSA